MANSSAACTASRYKLGMRRENDVNRLRCGKLFQDFFNRDIGPGNNGSALRIGCNPVIVYNVLLPELYVSGKYTAETRGCIWLCTREVYSQRERQNSRILTLFFELVKTIGCIRQKSASKEEH